MKGRFFTMPELLPPGDPQKDHTEILVHTGQQYDPEMSEVFFNELQIPKPDYTLGIGPGPHDKQTGLTLAKIG